MEQPRNKLLLVLYYFSISVIISVTDVGVTDSFTFRVGKLNTDQLSGI